MPQRGRGRRPEGAETRAKAAKGEEAPVRANLAAQASALRPLIVNNFNGPIARFILHQCEANNGSDDV